MQAGSRSPYGRGWVKPTTGVWLLIIDACEGVEGGGMEGEGMQLVLFAPGRRTLSNALVAEDHPRCFFILPLWFGEPDKDEKMDTPNSQVSEPRVFKTPPGMEGKSSSLSCSNTLLSVVCMVERFG
ncbi:hypothetical protein B0H14DRAFT_2565891 [Mycena olivaceomarginata]|nr:hypothetical protein B0H14DRAFT_2565891 [Mycena olivaceomarginata]